MGRRTLVRYKISKKIKKTIITEINCRATAEALYM